MNRTHRPFLQNPVLCPLCQHPTTRHLETGCHKVVPETGLTCACMMTETEAFAAVCNPPLYEYRSDNMQAHIEQAGRKLAAEHHPGVDLFAEAKVINEGIGFAYTAAGQATTGVTFSIAALIAVVNVASQILSGKAGK